MGGLTNRCLTTWLPRFLQVLEAPQVLALVGMAGVEPATPWFQAKNAPVTPHPETLPYISRAMGRQGFEPCPNGLKDRHARRYTSGPTSKE